MTDNLPPERVAELAEALCRLEGHPRLEFVIQDQHYAAQALAPLIGGWLAEAVGRVRESQDHADKTWRRARAAEMDAAEVRVRMEALAGEWERENAWGLGEQLSSAIRAALGAEREEGER